MSKILTQKDKLEMFNELLREPEYITRMDQYERAAVREYADSVISRQKTWWIDILTVNGPESEFYKTELTKALKAGYHRSMLAEYLINEHDGTYKSASYVSKIITRADNKAVVKTAPKEKKRLRSVERARAVYINMLFTKDLLSEKDQKIRKKVLPLIESEFPELTPIQRGHIWEALGAGARSILEQRPSHKYTTFEEKYPEEHKWAKEQLKIKHPEL
jgi:hypothetical protein